MIEKLIEIKSVGRFADYTAKATGDWNGELAKVNVIYAPNGSGKTTLSIIFKSLKLNDPKLIQFKKTFSDLKDQSVKMKVKSQTGIVEFKVGGWNSTLSNLEVFDIHYIEDYLFLGSILKKRTKENLFSLVLGQKGNEHKNRCRPLIVKRDKKVQALKKVSNTQLPEVKRQIEDLTERITPLLTEYHSFSGPVFDLNTQIVNKYLRTMAPYIKMKGFSHLQESSDTEVFRIFLEFDVRGNLVQFLSPDLTKKLPNAKFALSEGDKSAIAVAFFLARLEINGLQDKIIIFDDPLSSFDYARKTTTINNLAQMAAQSQQFFLLTHDLPFAKEFSDKNQVGNTLNLKIDDNGLSSSIVRHDIDAEMLTGLQRDIRQVKKYITAGAKSDSERKEVVRCIRPALEGLLKTKYFDEIPKGQWLGDIIGAIRQAAHGDRLFRLNRILSDLTELNDFSKRYHHGNASAFNDVVNPEELRTYCELLLRVVDEI